jgi:hypothetical protein
MAADVWQRARDRVDLAVLQVGFRRAQPVERAIARMRVGQCEKIARGRVEVALVVILIGGDGVGSFLAWCAHLRAAGGEQAQREDAAGQYR